MTNALRTAEILLPREGIDLSKWAVVACDQFTAQPEYWREVEGIVGDAPSALRVTLPEAWLSRGVLLDRDGSEILEARGVATGLKAGEKGVRRIGCWRLYRNADGGKFAVAEKSWHELDCTEATPTPVPVDEIWRFFTGGDLPVRITGAKGLHLMAKLRKDGKLAVLVNNMRGDASGSFSIFISGKPRRIDLAPYASTAFLCGS